jgi:hypothetical protein
LNCVAPHRTKKSTSSRRSSPKKSRKEKRNHKDQKTGSKKAQDPSIYCTNENPLFENVEIVAGRSSDHSLATTVECDESYEQSSYSSSSFLSPTDSVESFEEIIGKFYDVYGSKDMSELDAASEDGDWGYFVDFPDSSP